MHLSFCIQVNGFLKICFNTNYTFLFYAGQKLQFKYLIKKKWKEWWFFYNPKLSSNQNYFNNNNMYSSRVCPVTCISLTGFFQWCFHI